VLIFPTILSQFMLNVTLVSELRTAIGDLRLWRQIWVLFHYIQQATIWSFNLVVTSNSGPHNSEIGWQNFSPKKIAADCRGRLSCGRGQITYYLLYF